MRIGIDVGGTHTDAVVLRGNDIVVSTKALTSADVVSGVEQALDTVLSDGEVNQQDIEVVMIGTTQFTNAIVERRELAATAAIRIGLPSGKDLPPMIDWPDDIAEAVGREHHMLNGGHLYDGREIAPLDDEQINRAVAQLAKKDIKNVAVSAAFSPMMPEHEQIVAARIKAAIPDVRITRSNAFGRLGLMERENAAILNASLLPFAERVVASFLNATKRRGLTCPVFISQNDGTLMSADFVKTFPALTFASGPTNSLRGAARLTGIDEAIVVDIGGTTSDIGVLQKGFPRESGVVVEVGGVRTNFRMPDVLAVGLGGGSVVSPDGQSVGPHSVGHRLVTEGRVFGGETLTSTDILVASGASSIGNPDRVTGLDPTLISTAQATMHQMLDRAIDAMKPSSDPLPVILVGGGAVLVTGSLKAASKVIRPDNAGVANAIGAAIAQIGGEAERMMSYRAISREAALQSVTDDATRRAVAAGANPDTIRRIDVEETAVPYMDDGATRIRIKVIGDIGSLPGTGARSS
ncbi:MAG: hydantoinase/oxoprolinase N-terminal domain-containing protein [Lysobacterales bacterium]